MKIKNSMLIVILMGALSLSVLGINSSAEEASFSSDKSDRTLIKEIVMEQKELRAQQKEIKKMLSEQEQ